MVEFDSAASINQRMDCDGQETMMEDQGAQITLRSSRENTKRSLSSSSSSSSSSVCSSLNYDHCYVIANEKCIIEEHLCEADKNLDCTVCRYEAKFEVNARIWEERIAELISDDYNEDHWSDVELRGEVSGGDDSDLEKRLETFHFLDCYLEAITEHWREGYPRSAHRTLMALKKIIEKNISCLKQRYNLDSIVEFLTVEIEQEMMCMNLEGMDFFA